VPSVLDRDIGRDDLSEGVGALITAWRRGQLKWLASDGSGKSSRTLAHRIDGMAPFKATGLDQTVGMKLRSRQDAHQVLHSRAATVIKHLAKAKTVNYSKMRATHRPAGRGGGKTTRAHGSSCHQNCGRFGGSQPSASAIHSTNL
jgi:hypothetical protein